jgi:hypothetical protein
MTTTTTAPRTLTIGWTMSDRATGYSSFSDGYRPGAQQHTETVTVEAPADWSLAQLAEAVYVATNAPDASMMSGVALAINAAIDDNGYYGREAGHYSLSVGDTVTLDGDTVAVDRLGWKPVTIC